MENKTIFSDNGKNAVQKLVVMVIGIAFFGFCGKFFLDNSELVSRRLALGVNLTPFLNALGVVSYAMAALALVFIPINIVIGKGERIAVYDWGVEGACVSNTIKLKEFKFTYNKLTQAPKCQATNVVLFTSDGKITYHASNKASATRICDEIKKRSNVM